MGPLQDGRGRAGDGTDEGRICSTTHKCCTSEYGRVGTGGVHKRFALFVRDLGMPCAGLIVGIRGKSDEGAVL